MKRRRTKQGINLVNAAQSYIVASAATQALFGTNLAAFATQGWLTQKTPGHPAGMGAGNSWSLSASELVQGMLGQGFGFGSKYMADGGTLQSTIMRNLQTHGARSLGVIIAAPIAFNIGKKLTAAPRRDINKFLKFGNLKSVVKV